MHYFKDSLKKGNKGEALLRETYPFLKEDGCDGHDLIDKRTDSTIEVKTDSYSMRKTPNFFIEYYSDDKNFKLGGPRRAEQYGTDIFLYQFINDKTIFWFDDIPELVIRTEEYIKKHNLKPTEVRNKSYNTLGYKIPREALSSLFKVIKLGDDLPEV